MKAAKPLGRLEAVMDTTVIRALVVMIVSGDRCQHVVSDEVFML